jgi:uncharacterized protein
MAMLRAENEGFIKFKVEVDIDVCNYRRNSFKGQSASTPHVQLLEDSYKRLLNPAIANEALQEAAKADTNSIQVLLII